MKLRCLGSLTLLVFAISAIMLTSTVQAQRGGGRRGGGQRGGSAISSLLRQEDVQKELELLDDQVERLQGLEQSLGEEMRSGLPNWREMSDEERKKAMETMREAGRKLQAKLRSQVNNILLPHQSERLDQLVFQMGMRGGLTGALANPDIRQKLGISEDQQEELESKGQALEEELRKKVEKLRAEARDKLLSSLTSEQQVKIKKMMGKPFEFQQQPRRPGGAGGQRSGRPQGRRAR